MSSKFNFAIDRGGTFTDIYAKCPNGKERVMKLLSVDPTNYLDAPTEGIRRILEEETGVKLDPKEPIDSSNIEWIRMGTTVATNALLERKGERMALVINKGFKDILAIGNQARPKIFDLEIVTPEMLYEEVIEIDCRVIPSSPRCHFPRSHWKRTVTGTTDEQLFVTSELDTTDIVSKLQIIKEKGIESIAVVLMHSYTYTADEFTIGRIAESMGFTAVSLSHIVMPMLRIVSRGYTACADAYLTPCIIRYLKDFVSGFSNNLRNTNVLFMQSDGGLTPMNCFNGSRAVLSGPAGGVVGYAKTAYLNTAVIGFDMGGTSTDVSRYDGTYEHVFESVTAGITIQAPQLDVNTVAAGGGSRLFFRSGMFVVGPDSASAHPGPVCYRKGGYLTVTDANLVLGRLLPEFFPKIFGPLENEPLDKDGTILAFQVLAEEINSFQRSIGKELMTIEEIAIGFIRVANETMCRPIRSLTQAKGYDTRNHVLACFGGAGGQHACAISRQLGIQKVFIHKYAGILSAYGMACADVVVESQEPCAKSYAKENFTYFDDRLAALKEECSKKLKSQGFSSENIMLESFLHLRYEGTDCALMCSSIEAGDSAPRDGDFETVFLEKYKKEFGFVLTGRKILVDDIRIRGIGKSNISPVERQSWSGPTTTPIPKKITNVYFENNCYLQTNVYIFEELIAGNRIQGPAVIIDKLSTLLLEPGCTASITLSMDIEVIIGDCGVSRVDEKLDAIQLSIFSHRFMSIAEQMGRVLQRTAISTNIKERLDFSCALFGPDGGLVSNAPHIPVHLGAMQETVQYQLKHVGEELEEGDVILSNHPKAGGSHLPDLTVITPVFYESETRPVFFVASRGHHADIGGITPGSMPPHSKSLSEEGATFKSFFLIKKGIFREKEVTDALMAPGLIPNSYGTRNLSDNLSDLRAQVASNQRGIYLVAELIDYYGLNVVQAYMKHIQNNAEVAVRDLLRTVAKETRKRTGQSILSAIDYLDDGAAIALMVSINAETGSAIFDFNGTSYELWGNCNAPKAITLSAIIYCLRCMVGHDVPLNQGCLTPIDVRIPEGCLLDPSDTAAVVGGNVQTSQRIVDVIFKAFKTAAASQGCMNNITFGQDDWGYYETVAGGAGAGPSWHGKSGVHVHMTNTRITDPEVLERRYPVVLKKFSLRENSGGKGKFNGGNGIIREILFRAPVTLSILTERRVFDPYGLEGGEPGVKGENLLIRSNGKIIRLPSKTAVFMNPGDTFRLLTPGGGGYGPLEDDSSKECRPLKRKAITSFQERGSVHKYKLEQESV